MGTIHTMASKLTRQASLKTNESINFMRSRLAGLLGFTHEGSRDLYATFGYPREITTELLWALYLRGGLAHRIVKSFPQATWREVPSIGDGEGDSPETGESFSTFSYECHQFLKKHKVLHFLERADRLASIGRYGLLVLGFKDGRKLIDPMDGQAELAYLSPYSELNVTISKWDVDPTSERYGKPLIYTVSGNSIIDGGRTQAPSKSFSIHYSRVLHIVESPEEDDTFGTPRLMPIVNYLQDLDKTMGGAAETFWLTANRGVAVWADKDAILTDEQTKDIKEQIEEFSHQQKRWLAGQGMTAQVLGSESPDPAPNVEKQLDLIAGTIRMPKRIMVGSERGELSSGQDENAWNLVIDERRQNFAGPCILQEFIKRMIETGNLPTPKPKEKPKNTKGEMREPITLYRPPPPPAPFGNQEREDIDFEIKWPDTATIGPVEESQVMVSKTNALTTYARTPGVEMIMPVPEFRRDVLGLPPESEYELPVVEDPLDEGGIDSLTGEPLEPGEDAPEDDIGDDDEGAVTNAQGDLRSLYVRRDVLNRAALRSWAEKNGITGIVDDFHVTVMYSNHKVDWSLINGDSDDKLMVVPNNERAMTILGDSLVLEFYNADLEKRHLALKVMGAEHGHPTYRPHVTIAKAEGNDPSTITPYWGSIALGPEVKEEVK